MYICVDSRIKYHNNFFKADIDAIKPVMALMINIGQLIKRIF